MIKDGLKDKTENADYQVRGCTAATDMSLPPNSHHVWLHNKGFPLLARGLKSNNMDSGSSALVSTHINKQHNKKLHGQHVIAATVLFFQTVLNAPVRILSQLLLYIPVPRLHQFSSDHVNILSYYPSADLRFLFCFHLTQMNTHKTGGSIKNGAKFLAFFLSFFSLSLSRYFSSFLQM